MTNDEHSQSTFIEIIKAKLKRALILISRILAVLIMISIAVALGYFIPKICIQYFSQKGLSQHFLYGGAALGAGIVLTTFKSLAESIPVVWAYISSGTTEKLAVFFARTFIAVLGFYFALFSIQPVIPGESGGAPVVLSFPRDPLPVMVRDDDSLITFYITFSEGSPKLTKDEDQDKDQDQYQYPQIKLLDSMLRSINECLISNQDTVKLRVVGFASTSGTDEANLKLSNKRAEWIADYIKKSPLIAYQDRLEVRVDRWASYFEMKRHRIFEDRPRDEVYSKKAGLLNRRVEIHLLQAAGCEF